MEIKIIVCKICKKNILNKSKIQFAYLHSHIKIIKNNLSMIKCTFCDMVWIWEKSYAYYNPYRFKLKKLISIFDPEYIIWQLK